MTAYERVINELLGRAMRAAEDAIAAADEPYTTSADYVDCRVKDSLHWLLLVDDLEDIASETGDGERQAERLSEELLAVYNAARRMYGVAYNAQEGQLAAERRNRP